MKCLSAYKQKIPLLIQYQLSKVIVPLSQYECVRPGTIRPLVQTDRFVLHEAPYHGDVMPPTMSPRYRHSAIKITSTNLVPFFQAAYFHYKLHIYEGQLISNAHSGISRKRDHVFKQTKVGS
jgi:hypothetical protein